MSHVACRSFRESRAAALPPILWKFGNPKYANTDGERPEGKPGCCASATVAVKLITAHRHLPERLQIVRV
jgi:hypothetical protein